MTLAKLRHKDTIHTHKAMKDKLTENPFFVKAMEYINTHDLSTMECRKHIIDGDNLWVTIMDCEMKNQEDARLEVHNRYIDIQIPLSVEEKIGVKDRSACNLPDGEFDEERDILFFNDPYEKIVTVGVGDIITLTPNDAHAPLIGKGMIHKAVFKVKVVQ